MKSHKSTNTKPAQVVPKKEMASVFMVPKKSTSLLQIPIQHYATVNLMTEVPPKIHIKQKPNILDSGKSGDLN